MAQSKKQAVETIGSVEMIDFPELDVYGVPAKVDTGADNSAIWASDIKMKDGILQFKLFAAGSSFYTGTHIRTKEFRTTSVKNSFGHAEFRYKASFLVSIGERKIRTWFNLSDRAGMSYPVLIGRNILRNKYVVDVSKHRVHGRAHRRQVLILATNTNGLEKFFQEVNADMPGKASFVVRSYRQIAFQIGPRRVKIYETETGKDLARFDLVYIKSHRKYYAFAVSVAQYLQFHNVRFFDRELSTHVTYDKLSEYIRLSLYNLPVPATFSASTDYLIKNLDKVTKGLGWPLVCKEILEDRGRKNFMVNSKTELKKLLAGAGEQDIYALQTYVPNDGYQRVLVFGKQVALAVARTPVAHKNPMKRHLNAPAGSSNAEVVPEETIDPTVRDLSIRAADVMNRQIAGIDIIYNTKAKRWFILEANGAPQLRSGSFVDEKAKALAKFVDFELNR